MKYKYWGLFFISLLIMQTACDWNSHTEPKIEVDNASIRGQAIFINQSPARPMGMETLYVNEGDTLVMNMSTALLKEPVYQFDVDNADVLKIEKDGADNMLAYAVAVGDSGETTILNLEDTGNGAVKMVAVEIVKHWADPAYYTYLGSFGGHYYYLSNSIKGWVSAVDACEEAGGYLVAIGTPEENAFLHNARGMIENVWVGVRFLEIEGEWTLDTWVNGEPVDYRNFNGSPSEPGIFAEFYFHMDVNGRWESWHEISYNYFLEME